MDNGEDRNPSWVGRAVTTAELPAIVKGGGRNDRRIEEPAYDPVDPEPAPESVAPEPSEPPPDEQADRGLPLVGVMLAALALIVAVAAVAGFLNDRSGDDPVVGAASPDDERGTALDGAGEGRTGDDPELEATAGEVSTIDDPPLDEATPATVPGVSEVVIEAHRREAAATGEPAWAIYIDGTIYLQGEVPDAEAAALLSQRLQSILGPDNVVSQYRIDPASRRPVDPPLFIKETVAFDPESTTLSPGADWILTLADVLMQRFPTTTLTVVADPFASGSADTDPGIELTEQRVEAIIAYLVERGIEPSRLGSEVRERSLGVTEAGSKPVEFVVRGLLAAD